MNISKISQRLEKQMNFIKEMDKLKSIRRRSLLINEDRAENDAEHSWHLALAAIILSEYSSEKIDLLKVMKMVIIHDIVEIDAGDTYCYDKEGLKTQEKREMEAAQKLFGMLPKDQKTELFTLWHEFEDKQTPEAKFAASLDRLQPILLNYSKGGIAWKKRKIKRQQVEERQNVTQEGSQDIYNYIMEVIEAAYNEGMLQ